MKRPVDSHGLWERERASIKTRGSRSHVADWTSYGVVLVLFLLFLFFHYVQPHIDFERSY